MNGSYPSTIIRKSICLFFGVACLHYFGGRDVVFCGRHKEERNCSFRRRGRRRTDQNKHNESTNKKIEKLKQEYNQHTNVVINNCSVEQANTHDRHAIPAARPPTSLSCCQSSSRSIVKVVAIIFLHTFESPQH